METKIKEIQDYFKARILTGDFEVEKRESHLYTLKVDDKFYFYIWVGNLENEIFTNLYSNTQSFIDLDFTRPEREQLVNILKRDYNNFLIETEIQKKEQELETLKQKLN